MPTLIVLRHAKAESPLGVADIERPLSSRGRRDAGVAGELLRGRDLVADLVLCSPAVRTRQTLAEMASAAPVSYEPTIYDNDPDLLLDLLREQSGGTVLLIGHNPSLHQLVADLAEEPEKGFPTAAIAAIDLDGAWSDISAGSGTLTYSTVARA